VWLADLTHTTRGPASEAFPYSVGCLAEYLISTGTIGRQAIRIVKFPADLTALAATGQSPLLVGFSHYMWNSRLSLAYAGRIARRWPHAVIVFGGPHYPLAEDERIAFLRANPQISFYAEHEGEQVLDALVRSLLAGAAAAELHGTIPGLHSIAPDGTACLPAPPPRLPDLEAVPSPYVSGLMDPFFSGELVPLLETNRGCPFSCTFCSEGIRYYNRVTRRPGERTREELLYIGERLAPLIALGRARNELILADSNFGMYAQDQDVCEAIAECQDRYGWPAFVNATTGKNRKDQVLLAIDTARGALELTGSVQTLDQQVLKNIKRANISTDVLVDVVLKARGNATGTYSEVILGLPGDTRSSHVDTMERLVESGFDTVRPYQLCFLPGTEVASRETRQQFGMVGRFRVLPRCFGAYEWIDGDIIRAAEIDEICVAQDSMLFTDYLECRVFDLFVHLFHNDGPFAALEKVIVEKGCRIGRWISACLAADRPPGFASLVDDFTASTAGQLRGSAAELTSFVERPDIMAQHIDGRLGNNVLHTFRGRAFTENFADLVAIAEAATLRVLADGGADTAAIREFIHAAVAYHVGRCEGVLEDPPDPDRTVRLDYDVPGYLAARGDADVESFRLAAPRTYRLTLSPRQQDSIAYDAEIDSASDSGRGRLLARTLPGSLWRMPVEPAVPERTCPP